MMSVNMMKSVDPKTVDRNALIQRSSVRLDPTASREERLRDFIQQIKNPYCFCVGDVVVNVAYTKGGATLDDCFADLLSIL